MWTMARFLVNGLLGLALTLGPAAVGAAQGNKPQGNKPQGNKPNANRQDEKREDERVRQAQQAVQQAQDRHKAVLKDVQEAGEKLRKAEFEQKLAIDKVQTARRAAEELHEARQGMPRLLEQQTAVQKAYDAAAAPVLDALRQSSDYQTAAGQAQDAQRQLQALRQRDPQAVASRDPRVSEWIRQTLRPGQLEQQALAGDSAAAAAQARLSEVQSQVAAVRQKVKSAVESDTALRAALKSLDQHNAALQRAQASLAQERQQVTSAVAALQREREKLAQAVAADRKDDNQPKKKKKKR
jgi:hypothetical protein